MSAQMSLIAHDRFHMLYILTYLDVNTQSIKSVPFLEDILSLPGISKILSVTIIEFHIKSKT